MTKILQARLDGQTECGICGEDVELEEMFYTEDDNGRTRSIAHAECYCGIRTKKNYG